MVPFLLQIIATMDMHYLGFGDELRFSRKPCLLYACEFLTKCLENSRKKTKQPMHTDPPLN